MGATSGYRLIWTKDGNDVGGHSRSYRVKFRGQEGNRRAKFHQNPVRIARSRESTDKIVR